ncbi:TPA: DUF3945 domain-containing protein [Elizabethkingia anophelis]|uniref:DUF3945 domain-containing protein n=1 Tax=Elizabethkingia anophelis TaxID=1117645 RepID=A0A455ZEU6_9FLAO|nr:DUF3945 domain-containing protein [Elizabethkingia anophelis]AQW94892.1 hypothetical protein BBD30_12270 [Elizabethkingia anophelis]MCL1690591.1 DUF3945 domain-containing protein [Elizabethkingia anophelis]MDV3950860.1 hypothetical protein [Elizabethkingia anophelis]MDV4010156.1 hypothetical protein [Elizabethkingia anophelis]MYY49883.1 DUF3945 domain-containing protein [Elizabethkingia anophelis]
MDDINIEELLLRKELSDILLVLDKRKMKIQAVTGIGENGEPQTVDPTKKNQNQFMRVDKSGDMFSNFFSNFLSQLRNPTNFSFFKVSGADAVTIADKMQKQVDNPSMEGEKLMKKHEVKTEKYRQDHKTLNTTDMEETSQQIKSGEYRYGPEQIDWETMSNLGLSKERLEKLNVLEPLLKGYKTNELIPISLNFGKVISKMDARLSLQPDDKGQLVVAIHGIRKEPQLNFPFFGHEFTKEDKENLLTSGNMGRVVDLKNFKTGEIMPSVISIDRLTNELIALKSEYIKIPDEIKGVKLDEQQKQTLKEGKPLYIEGMISKKGEPFDATLQFNADKRYVEFLFDRNNSDQKVNNNQQHEKVNAPQEIPKVFRGKELTDEQYNQFKEGQSVYLTGLVDRKGTEYEGFITLNKEKGTTDFSFQDPDKFAKQVKQEDSKMSSKVAKVEKEKKQEIKQVQSKPRSRKM